MKINTLRRPYAAPIAELICLAPATPIANNWTWGTNKGKWNQNSWSASSVPEKLFDVASATGFAGWTGEDELSKTDSN